jgi:predicted transcriptional regulator
MNKRKIDYSKSYKKKIVQQIVFDSFKERGFTQLIGLAGPNITDYLSFVKSKGIKQAEVYERDYINLIYQMQDFKPPIKTTVKYQDILHADIKENVIYDLDFCCTITNAEEHIKKFKKNAIFTLALRGIGLVPTLERFCELVSKIKSNIHLNVHQTPNFKMHLLYFEKTSYTVYHYCDTSAMIVIKPNF